MLKFRVGDKVVVSEHGLEVLWSEYNPDWIFCKRGVILLITDVDVGDEQPYLVQTVGDVFADCWMAESELEPYVESMEND